MAAVSYDQLLRQVEVLKMENSTLRQELQDNSNHLTKLETEALNMKVSSAGRGSGSELRPIQRRGGRLFVPGEDVSRSRSFSFVII